MSNATIVRKLSVKAIVGSLKAVVAERTAKDYKGDNALKDGDRLPVARIYGIAKGIETGESTYGEWTALKGTHKGVNLETGEMFQAPKAFLPDVATDLIKEALADADELEYAFEIVAVVDTSMKEGYSYQVAPLMEAEPSLDPLARIEAQLNGVALEAPKEENS